MIFTIKIKKFSLYVSLLFHKDIQKGEEIQNNSFTGLGMQFPLLMCMETAYPFSYHQYLFFCTCLGVDENSRIS